MAPAVGFEAEKDVAIGSEACPQRGISHSMDTPGHLSTPPRTIVGQMDRGFEGGPGETSTPAKRATEFAELYLHAGACGLPCAELARTLAEAVLGMPEVVLARRVLEGGEQAHVAATELAGRIGQIHSHTVVVRNDLTTPF